MKRKIAYKIVVGNERFGYGSCCGRGYSYGIGKKTRPKFTWGPIATFDSIAAANSSLLCGDILKCEIKESIFKKLWRFPNIAGVDVRAFFPGTIYASWVKPISIVER